MSYEKEIAYLKDEFKKSEDKFREAEREGYETDADIWQDDMVNIGHQIHIHEQAAKADEYEAKAKAFDRIKAYSDKAINGDINSLLLAEGIIDVVEQYDINRLSESGELE